MRADLTMCPDPTDRRSFLVRTIAAITATLTSLMAVVLGGAVFSPGLRRRQDFWAPAALLADLEEGVLKTVHVQTARIDGYLHTIDRQVVFLTKSVDAEVTALSSICTHLGCRVVWDAQARLLRCPCHGGVFSATGEVQAGPPRHPLTRLSTRLDGDTVLVRL